jgi:hypothetical protein
MGDGPYSSVLLFTNDAATNFLQFMVHNVAPENSAYSLFSNFKLRDIGIWGPGSTNLVMEIPGTAAENTNILANGVFMGVAMPAPSNCGGWNDTIENCSIIGWKVGVVATNMVRFQVHNCIFKYNWFVGALMAGADTFTIDHNIFLNNSQPALTNELAAIYLTSQTGGGGNAGRGGDVGYNEIGGYRFAILGDGPFGSFTSMCGNFERNGAVIGLSNACSVTAIRPQALCNENTMPGAFIFGDSASSAASRFIDMQIGSITNSTSANSQNTNFFVMYDAGASYRPPHVMAATPVAGVPATDFYYSQFDGAPVNVFTDPNPNLETYWAGKLMMPSSAHGQISLGADRTDANPKNTMTANTQKFGSIKFADYGDTMGTWSIGGLTMNASDASTRILEVGGNDPFGGGITPTIIDLVTSGSVAWRVTSSGTLADWGTHNVSINGNLSTGQGNKAALISSNVTTSPYLWTNTLGYDCSVYVSQGTNNGICLNTTLIGFFTNTCTTLLAQPNEFIWVTNNGGRPSFLIKPL